MKMTLAGAALGLKAAPAVAQPSPLPKRDTLSVNMRSDEQLVVKMPQTSTYMATLPLEAGATAIRIGIANTTPHTFQIGGVCVAESAEWQPNPQPGWAYFSFSGDKAESTMPPATAPVPVTIRGDEGSFNVPRITWSDWMHYRTISGPQRPQLLFRTLVPAQELVLMAFPAGPGVYSPATAGQPERLASQALVLGDFVTNLNLPLPPATQSKLSPIYVIQFRATTPGLQMVIGGDSHLAMSHTFAVLAANALSTPAAPISVWNTAWAAKSSNTFWPALDQAINYARPSLTVIQGWTANDGMTPPADQAYLIRVKESAARTFAAGGLPIIVKALPRHLAGQPELGSWKAINQQLDNLVPGALVFDPGPSLYDTQAAGNYIAGLSDDGVHPNTRGNMLLSQAFQRLIAPYVT